MIHPTQKLHLCPVLSDCTTASEETDCPFAPTGQPKTHTHTRAHKGAHNSPSPLFLLDLICIYCPKKYHSTLSFHLQPLIRGCDKHPHKYDYHLLHYAMLIVYICYTLLGHILIYKYVCLDIILCLLVYKVEGYYYSYTIS